MGASVITAPGIYNTPAAEYHADPCPQPSLSSSVAKILLDQSPLHAWHAHPRLNPYYEPDVDDKFDLGTAAHMLLLERRADGIVIVRADDWRSKAAKESRDQARAEGKTPILEHQYERADRMVRAAYEFIDTTAFGGIFQLGLAEQTVVWEENGVWCRCRPDLWWGEVRIILDYKTTENAQPDAFIRQIGRMSYHTQAEFYTRGLATLGPSPAFVFLAQETTPPHACSLIALSNAYRAIGQQRVEKAISGWRNFLTTKNWPSYTNQICYAEPKPWELLSLEETIHNQESPS